MSNPLEASDATARPAVAFPTFLYVGSALAGSSSLASRWLEDPLHPERLQWVPVWWIIWTVGVCLAAVGIAFEIIRRRAATKWDAEHRPLGYFPARRPSPRMRRLKVAQRSLVVSGFGLMLVGGLAAAVGFENANQIAIVGVFAGLAVLLASLVVTLVFLSADAQERYDRARK